MRDKRLIDARNRAKSKLEEVAEESPEIQTLIKLAKAGFTKALDRLIIIMDSDSNDNVDAALAVYNLVKENNVSMMDKTAKIEKITGE